MQYRVNAPQVIAETVGGETIIVNLATGHYFNLQGTAVEVWESIERVEPVSSMVQGLAARYDAADGEIEAAVTGLIRDLEQADLIAGAELNGQPADPLPAPEPSAERKPFVAPTLAAYTDMQDIILLDPVHEVDATGWPHASAGA
jgi:hypothetical protein